MTSQRTHKSHRPNLSEKRLLIVLSIVVGIIVGLAAVLLEELIKLIHTGLSSAISGSARPVLYLVFPGIGMLLAMLFVRYVIKDNIGHGVTKVLVAVSKHDSRIKGHNVWSSIFASSVTIGFGGSVGAEAPIVYTGAAIGSNVARLFHLSYRNMTILLGCGAAAALAGIFRAPLAGVLFTLEILLFNISMTSMMPLLLATVSATTVAYLFQGATTPFTCTLTRFSMMNIPFYLVFGLLCGLLSVYFLRTTLFLEDKIGKLHNSYLKWILCAVGLGVLIFLFPPLYGEGYDSLGALLNGEQINLEGMTVLAPLLNNSWGIVVFFLLIMLFKVFSMTLTNAGGGVGGTFGPTLFVGAVAGFVMARTANLIFAGSGITVPEQNFVLVGMAALMAGVMQAPMTAIFLIAEISGGYELLLPLILTSAVSFGTTRIFEKYSIYTKRIAQSGELLTHDSDQAVLTLMKTTNLVETNFSAIKIDATLGQLVETVSNSNRNIFPVLDSHNRFQGYVILEDIRKVMFQTDLYDKMHVFNFMTSTPEYIYDDEKMDSVMDKFERTGAWNLPVVKHDRTYIGFLSKSRILSAYRQELREFSQD